MLRLVAVLAITACVAPKPVANTKPPGLTPSENPDFVCRPMADTGSLIAHDECVPRDKTADHDDVQQMLGKARPSSPPGTADHNPNQR